MKGFSPRNLKYMRAFAEAWPEAEFVQAVLAQLPCYHQLRLPEKFPAELQTSLPSNEQIESELGGIEL